jgi:hypothetical protein
MSIIQKKLINTNSSGGGSITLPIEISDVNGLQASLNSKANATELATYLKIDDFNTVIDGYVTDTELTTGLNSKANVTDFNNLKTYVDLPKNYERTFIKTTASTITETISGNASIRILDRVSVVLGKKNDDYVFTSGTNAFIKEVINSSLNYKKLSFRITFYNDVAMGNTPLEIQVWRNTPTPTQVLTTSGTKITNTDTDTRVETSLISTYSKLSTDPYVVNGYYFIVKNLSATTFTYKQMQIDMFISVEKAVNT